MLIIESPEMLKREKKGRKRFSTGFVAEGLKTFSHAYFLSRQGLRFSATPALSFSDL